MRTDADDLAGVRNPAIELLLSHTQPWQTDGAGSAGNHRACSQLSGREGGI